MSKRKKQVTEKSSTLRYVGNADRFAARMEDARQAGRTWRREQEKRGRIVGRASRGREPRMEYPGAIGGAR